MAAVKAFGIAPPTWLSSSPEAEKVEQIAYMRFFVPYWLVRIGLYAPVIHADPQKTYSEGRLSTDFTFSLAGTNHEALSMLHFANTTTEMPSSVVNNSHLASSHVNVPYSLEPPLTFREWFENIFEEQDILIARNVQIRPRSVQCRVAANPILKSVALGEFRYRGEYLTVAHCPHVKSALENIRVYRKGSWDKPGRFGPIDASYSIAWTDKDPTGTIKSFYTELEASLYQKADHWLQHAITKYPLKGLKDNIWENSVIGSEGFRAVRSWREGKLDLWQEGYEFNDT